MRETGTVAKIISDDLVEVEMKSTAGCAKCGLCKIGMNNQVYLDAKTKEKLSVGDIVEIETNEREVILATFLIFILPLIIFFVGYIIFNHIFSVIAPIVYYFGLWLYDMDSKKKGKYLPFVVRKV